MPNHLDQKRLKSAKLALFVIFFTQAFAAITTLPRIPELIDQIGVNFAEWGAIIGFAGLGSLLPLVFTIFHALTVLPTPSLAGSSSVPVVTLESP